MRKLKRIGIILLIAIALVAIFVLIRVFLPSIVFWIALLILPAILLLILIIFLIFGFARLKYSIEGHVGDKNTARVEVSYFLRLVHVVITYANGKLTNRIRIAWIHLGDDKPRSKRQRQQRKRPPALTKAVDNAVKNCAVNGDRPTEYSTADNTVRDYSVAIQNEAEVESSMPKTAKQSDAPIMTKSPPHGSSAKAKSSRKPNPQPPSDPTPESVEPKKDKKNNGPSILDQIKAVWTYPDRKTIMALSFRAIQKLLNALKPNHLEISGIIGFEDPANTGWFMGTYEAMLGVFSKNPRRRFWRKDTIALRDRISLLGCYFEKALRLDIEIAGRTRPIRLIWPFIWLYLQRPIRKLVNKLIFK